MSSIAFVTYRDLPHLTSEDQLVCSFLQTLGVQAHAVIWDAQDIAWDTYQAVVVRSCWDYHLHASRYITWLRHLERLQIPLWNPAPILHWNLHKTYLRDLQTQGVAVPPTCWLKRDSKAELTTILQTMAGRRRLSSQPFLQPPIKPGASPASRAGRTSHDLTRFCNTQICWCSNSWIPS